VIFNVFSLDEQQLGVQEINISVDCMWVIGAHFLIFLNFNKFLIFNNNFHYNWIFNKIIFKIHPQIFFTHLTDLLKIEKDNERIRMMPQHMCHTILRKEVKVH
jgi:hypothetical protein